jgi:hypothetical protein
VWLSPQNGAAGFVQSVLTVHWMQRPSVLQMGVLVPAQSLFERHWTHSELVVLQWGVGAPHCASVVQPETQRNSLSLGLQICPAPQSAFDRHTTQRPPPAKQRGALAGQSVLATHCWQVEVAVLQTAVGAAQSVAALHPMHAPVEESQIFAVGGHVVAAQAGWQR